MGGAHVVIRDSKQLGFPARHGMTRADLEEQRINFAFGNAPEGAAKWVTRKSLRKVAADRVFIGPQTRHRRKP